MTTPLYHFSDDLSVEVRVLSCRRIRHDYELILDKTPFHPQGGGQMSDVGYIGHAKIAKVTKSVGLIKHYSDQPLPTGLHRAIVDREVREASSRSHTAGHLIGCALSESGYTATRASHFPGDSWVRATPRSKETEFFNEADLESRLNALIDADMKRFITIRDGYREVRFGDLMPIPCGGTHVASTGAIAKCRIVAIEAKEAEIFVRYCAE